MAKPQTHINRIGMWMAYGGDGMKTWFVCEIDKEHDEGLKELGSRYTSYFNVEGYKVSIIPIIKPEEAIALLGAEFARSDITVLLLGQQEPSLLDIGVCHSKTG
jgi:hypothetical protein